MGRHFEAKSSPSSSFLCLDGCYRKILTNDTIWERDRWCWWELVLFVQGWWRIHWSSFLHCSLAKQLWDTILTLFGVHWVMPRKLQDLIACWHGPLGRLSYAVIWKAIPHCLMWSIWRERNLRTFEGRELSLPELQSFFFRMHWMQVTGLFSFSSFQDFIDSCSPNSLLP